ncbi:MAG: hypothetical protein AAGE43_02680, partial [Pseudomonadota bacterium]
CSYLLDVILTILDTLLGLTGSNAIHLARQVVAYLVMLIAGVWLVTLVLFGDVLRKWLLFWLALSAFWLNTGAQPVGLFFEDPRNPSYIHVLIALQAAMIAITLLSIRRRFGRWWVTEGVAAGFATGFFPWLGRFLGRAVTIGALWLIYQPFAAMGIIEQSTGGYVSFTWDGILTRDVTLSDQAGQSVRLVGMMHFGEPVAYQELLESFEAADSIVLEEGVTDESGLLDAAPLTLRWGRNRGGIAVQPGMKEIRGARRITALEDRHAWVNVQNADLDTSELGAETLAWVRNYATLRKRAERQNFPLLFVLEELSASFSEGVFNDILFERNDRLLAHITATRGEFERVVVPWGAMHMPGIEASLIKLGFRDTGTERRWMLLRWKTLIAALRGSAMPVERTLTTEALEAYAMRSVEAMQLTRRPALALFPANSPSSTTPGLEPAGGGQLSGGGDSPPIGVMGGLPTRFAGEQWPRNTETGMPLGFVLEINRSVTHGAFFGSIRRIRLFVDYSEFFGENEEAAYAVLIDRVGDPVREIIEWTPRELDALAAEFGPEQRDYGAQLTWPATALQSRPTQMADRELLPMKPFAVDRKTMLEWFDISDRVEAEFKQAYPELLLDFDSTHIGGYPQWVQFPESAGDLPFFLQVTPTDEMNWVDAGIFYLFLDPADPSRVVLLGQFS